MKKVPLTARIDPALSLKLETMQKETKEDKTACLESALNFFFENCPNISEARPPADQELVRALIDALQSPEVIKVIQACITQNNTVIKPYDTAEKEENKQSVRQPCDTVIPDRNTQENNQIQVKPEFKSHKKQDQAGPTEEEIDTAFSRTLEELFSQEELAKIQEMTPKEKEEIRESLALVSWSREIQKTYGGSLKVACKKAGTSEASYRRKLKKLEKFDLLYVDIIRAYL